MSTGSLGLGISAACGMALSAKAFGKNYRVYTVIGDGESEEGQVWEAAMFTAAKKLTNLVWLIDWNKKQLDGYVSDILEPFDFEEKFRAFGFDACTIDGNDVAQLKEALSKKATDKPIAIILDTVKGKGVTEVEEAAGNHSMNVGAEVFDGWIDEIKGKLAALEA
jgi:transketolase